jgi:hypothetical protein
VLGPLLQSRLVSTVGLAAAALRYRPLEPVRDVVLTGLPDDVRRVREAAVTDRLLAIARSSGGPLSQTDHDGVAAVEADLGNLRHWVPRTVGTATGLDLAIALATPMSEIGFGAEGARWLDDHLAATPDIDPLVGARATLARLAVRGFFAGAAIVSDLEAALKIADAHEDWRLWLGLGGRLALALAWEGEVERAAALVEGNRIAELLRDLADPWMDVQHQRLGAFLLAARGDIRSALAELRAVTDRMDEIGDHSSAMSTIWFRAYLARAIGDDELYLSELLLAREHCYTGAARSSQALVAVELAHHAHRTDDPAASALLVEAIELLERSGNLRTAAIARRDLGLWRIDAGDVGGVQELRAALPTLLRRERAEAALAVAEIAASIRGERASDAERLLRAARALLLAGEGTPLSVADHSRIHRVLSTVVPSAGDEPPDDAEIIALAGTGPAAR